MFVYIILLILSLLIKLFLVLSYTFNPNGSEMGVAALTSKDGRHLAMMPHPERCTQMWQWPYLQKEWYDVKKSFWCKMFANAFEWCTQQG